MPKIIYKKEKGIKRNSSVFDKCATVEDLKSDFEKTVQTLTDAGQIQELLNAYNAKLAELSNTVQNAQASPSVGLDIYPEVPQILEPADSNLIEQPLATDVTPTSSSIADEAIVTQYNRLTKNNNVKSNNNPKSIIEHRETFRCLGYNG